MKRISPKTGIIIFLIAISLISYFNSRTFEKENKKLKANQEALLDSISHFVIADSLDAITVGNLELSLKQYKKYHTDDATIIAQLKGQKPKVISSIETRTEYSIKTILKDSIIYKDTLKTILYTDKWSNITGFIAKDTISLSIKSNEELLITESLQKKKFLFFKLPVSIFGYKRKTLNVISKNPNTNIVSAEYITIN
jgi:hypothetical protein